MKFTTLETGKKIFFFFVFIIILSTASCGEDKKKIKIGFSGNLTGYFSDLGIDSRDAVLLAIDEVNKKGGINGHLIELIVKDDKHDAETARKVDTELINEGVVAIIGHMTSAMTMAVVDLINKNKTLMISPTTSTHKLSGIDDYFFRVINSTYSQTRHLAEFCFNKTGVKKVVSVYDLSNRSYVENWNYNFKSVFEKLGGEQFHGQGFYSGKDLDYLGLAKKILNYNPDGLLIVARATDTALISQQLKKLNSKIPIFASGWALTSDLINHGGAAVEGMLFAQKFNKESKNKNYLAFKRSFKKRFEREPNFASVFSYDSAQVLFYALSQSTSKDKLREIIIEKNEFDGLQTPFKIDKYGDVICPLYISVVKNGEFTLLE